MAEPVLELDHIAKSFGDLRILEDVNLRVGGGEVAAILGPSGAGKSTVLHIAGLMERPTGGSVRLLGNAADRLNDDERARQRLNTIGFLFQFHYLLPEFDVLENALIPARLAGDDVTAAETRAREILGRLGLSERLNHKPAQLSGGEQQRAALARAVMRRPKLLLCDEPTGNLDQHTADDVVKLIWSVVESEGLAAIVVTHNEALAQRATAAFRLKEGRFVDAAFPKRAGAL
jgi:lipoprotein-releasing system ATP-binding protein